MAIARNANNSQSSNNSTTVTRSFTVGSGTNRLLLAAVVDRAGDGVTGVTWGGVAMTQLVKQAVPNTGTYIYVYGLINPASGLADAVAMRSVGTGLFVLAVADYTGVKQTGLPEASAGNSATTATTVTATLNPVNASNCWAFAVVNSSDTASSGTNWTKIAGINDSYGDSNATIGTGSVGVIANQGNGDTSQIAIAAVAFAPSTATTYTNNLSDSLPITEALNRIVAYANRVTTHTLTMTENFSRTWSLMRSLTETQVITETISAMRFIILTLTDTFAGFTDTFSRTVQWVRQPSETITITEAMTRIKITILSISESIGLTEALTRVVIYARSLSESLPITELFATPLNWLKRVLPSISWTARTPPATPTWTARTPPNAPTWTPRQRP